MKRLFALFLALLLLCGCTPEPVSTEPVSDAPTTTAVPATEAVPLSGLSALTEGSVLLYRQADFNDRQGTLLPLETILSAPEEVLIPRAHLYDELFSEEEALWLRLLDYALANGYQGFSVPLGTIPELSLDQRQALSFLYRIESGKVFANDRDGATTVWYDCLKSDTMEKFALGLAAARQIAADAPRGDEWETVTWIFSCLSDRITYGDRDTYYFKRGHQLYDALVDGECVCTGYSDAMYYLCSLCGIECLSVEGTANNPDIPGGLDGHAWNIARVDGVWYVFDPTAHDCAGKLGFLFGFGLSTEAMYRMGGNKLTWESTDSMIPLCETCFDPVAAWNGTPEGALKSWLWYAVRAEAAPPILPLSSGFVTPETQLFPGEDGLSAVGDIPFADFTAWTLRFMSDECAAQFIPACFFETEDGMTGMRAVPVESSVDWTKIELASVSPNADGSFTADLGAAAAVFTVSQNADGSYFIETITLTPNP